MMSGGFTIVELMVVIVVIGILATFTIISYGGITKKAMVASIQSDLRNATKLLGMDAASDGIFPASESAANGGRGLTKGPDTTYQYTGMGNSYCISASSVSDANIIYHVDSSVGLIEDGVCPGLWKQVSAGYDHTCGISMDDKAYCWGNNNTGQLGDNTVVQKIKPTLVNVANGTSSLYNKTPFIISAGNTTSCAVTSDNISSCWGGGSNGKLGVNDSLGNPSYVPVLVNTANGVSALYNKTVKMVSQGDSHVCVIASDDKVYCWDSNTFGQLGDNSVTERRAPVAVNTTNGVSSLYNKTVIDISVGHLHTCALASDNTVHCWGSGSNGRLGNNLASNSSVPVAVNTANGVSSLYNKTVSAIGTGDGHSCALASDGTVHCWGTSAFGAIGENSVTQRNAPVPVNTTNGVSSLYGKTILSIGVGYERTCAVASDGTVHCWGIGSNGQRGDNSTVGTQLVPVAVNMVNGVSSLSGKSVVSVEVGESHTCVIASDKTAHCWGYNANGRLGDNTGTQRNVPVQVVKP